MLKGYVMFPIKLYDFCEASKNLGVLNRQAIIADTNINGIRFIGNMIINSSTTARGFFNMLAINDVVTIDIEIIGSMFKIMPKA